MREASTKNNCKNAQRIQGDFMNLIKKIKYRLNKEKRELFISRVSEVMTGLYVILRKICEDELKYYQDEADRFYSSPEICQKNEFREIRIKCGNRFEEKIRISGKEYLRQAGSDAEQALEKANEYFKRKSTSSAVTFYSDVLWGFLSSSDLTAEDKMNIGKEERSALIEVESKWAYVEENARKKHLKPIMKENLKPVHILHGTYGECTTCIGYDEEFKVYLTFNPDDNYRHWSGYNIYVITKELAERLAGKVFDYPETDIIITNKILNYEYSVEKRII